MPVLALSMLKISGKMRRSATSNTEELQQVRFLVNLRLFRFHGFDCNLRAVAAHGCDIDCAKRTLPDCSRVTSKLPLPALWP